MKLKEKYNLYYKTRKIRDIIFKPLMKIYVFFGITPDILSYLGIFMILGFVLTIKSNLSFAILFLLLCLFLDGNDGVLARYTKSNSDKGKFKDMVCDHITFNIFIIGLVYAGFLGGIYALIFIFALTLSKTFRIIYNGLHIKSNWYFITTAGSVPFAIVVISYIGFFIMIFSRFLYFNQLYTLFSIILFIDALYMYIKLVYKEK